MPDWLKNLNRSKDTPAQGRRFEGVTAAGAVVMRDERGRVQAQFPTDTKAETMGDDPLAIYKPTGAKAVDAAKAMGNFTNVTFAAINAIASEISGIQFRLYQVKQDDDHEELTDHELLTLLDGVNATMTGIEFKYTMSAHLELTGNCYILMDGVKNDTEQPKALHFLNPGRVRVKINKDVFPFTISHYEFTIDNKIFKFQPYQILHVKYPDPGDPFVGIGFVQTIPTWIDSDNYAMEYNRKYFLNGASFGMYIATQTNVEGNIDRIRRQFADKYGGVENAHKIPALPKGVDLKSAGMTHRDMDFSALAEVTQERILMAARVSRTILGTAESDTNRATAETADYVFSKRTIKPKMLMIIAYLNEFLTSRYGDDLYLTFIDPVQEDRAARITEMTAASGGVPLLTQNETRRTYLGMGDIPGGDTLLAPSTMEPIAKTEDQAGEDQTPNLAKGKAFERPHQVRTATGRLTNEIRIRTGGKTAFSKTHQMRKELRGAFEKALEDKMDGPAFKTVQELTHGEYMEHWKRFADRSEVAEKQLNEIFLGINKSQRDAVVENLSKTTGVGKKWTRKAVSDLFNMDEWITVTIDLATPILTSLTQDEAAAAQALIGTQSQNILADESTRAALDAGIQNMAKSYNQTTLDALKKEIGDKLTQNGGTSLPELTKTVDEVYEFANSRRAGLIAKTESFRAANSANLAAWQQSGVVKSVKWYTAEDEKVCPECQELDGKEVKIGEDFFTATYGEGTNPPAHPDCRCYIRPEEISIE